MVAKLHELIVKPRRQVWQEIRGPDKENRRHLPRAAADREDPSRQHSGKRVRQDDPEDGLTARSAERIAGVAVGLRHCAQGFFDAHNHNRQGQHRHRQRRPDEGRLAVRQLTGVELPVDCGADGAHKEPQAKQAKHDRGDAGQVVHGQARPAVEP